MDDRLQKFARLVELGSFTRAAKDLHISQPALTLAVNKLERELRTPLLIRTKRRLELTDAGRIVYSAAMEHKTVSENLRTSLVELTRERPKVAIGMIDSIAAVLSASAQPLDKLEARADVSIVVNNSRYLREAVESRELDLAFVIQDLASHPNLDIEPAGVESFAIVCRPDRRAAIQTELDAGKLQRFISYDRQSTSYGHIHQGLRKLGVTVRPTLYSTSPDVMLRMALRGRGVTALPYFLVQSLLETGKLVALKKRGQAITVRCPVDIVKVRGKVLPEALRIFSEQAKTTLKTPAGIE